MNNEKAKILESEILKPLKLKVVNQIFVVCYRF